MSWCKVDKEWIVIINSCMPTLLDEETPRILVKYSTGYYWLCQRGMTLCFQSLTVTFQCFSPVLISFHYELNGLVLLYFSIIDVLTLKPTDHILNLLKPRLNQTSFLSTCLCYVLCPSNTRKMTSTSMYYLGSSLLNLIFAVNHH